jgi:penicillin-binding protein 1A
MGIQSELPKVPSLVLGTAEVSLLEMAGAYAYIANGGGKVTPFSILKIEDENGNLLYQAKYNVFKKEEIAEPFQQIQQMMRAVITEGTGKGLQNTPIPYNLIGKTGTTQNNSDGWFIGSSPEVTVGAWVGALDKRVHFKSTSLGSGAHTALPMVARTFGDLSLWRKPILSDFAWSIPPFDCVAFSELPAAEAQLLRPLSDSLMTAGDSLLVEEAVSDSLGRDSLP